MAQKKKQSEGVGAWIAIVVLFVIGAWPIALIILFIKLFGSDSRRKQQTVRPWSRRHSRQAALPPPPAAAEPERPCTAP